MKQTAMIILVALLLLGPSMLCSASRPRLITIIVTNDNPSKPSAAATAAEDPIHTLEAKSGLFQYPFLGFLQRKLLRTVVVKDRSVAKVKENGKVVLKGDGAYAEPGTGTSETKVVTKTKYKTKKDGTTVVNTVTKGHSTSSPGGTSATGASTGSGVYGNDAGAGSYGYLGSSGGGEASLYAKGTGVSGKRGRLLVLLNT
jgi:hypothetical protein